MILATALWSQSALRFVLLGAATGSLTALVALGIVLVYRTSGVLNFSAGALGGIAAYVCYNMRDGGMPAAPAVALGLLVGVGLGLLTYLVMALLRDASRLARLIATLGLFSVFQSFMVLRWGLDFTQPRSLLPSKNITLFGDLVIGRDRLILIGFALVCAVVLRIIYSGTLFGLATSAVAENRRVAASAGWSPDRIEMANFAIAGGLSALAAILLAPIVGLNAAVLSLAVLPALAAALVGRFSSFGITVLAALGIGIVQSEISLFQPDIAKAFGMSTPSLTGLAAAVPLAIILVFLIATGRSRLQRGETLARLPLPGSGRISLLPVVVGIVMSVALLIGVSTWADALITTFAIAIILCSVVVVAGYAGQLSLCQFALAGLGAWIAARLVSADGWPFEAALVAAVIGTTIVGAVVALPAIRTRGTSLAVATLAIALMFSALIFTNSSVTGGVLGLPIERVSFLGIDLDPLGHPQRYGGFVLVVLVLVAMLVANLRRGRSGARLLAVRGERAAASLGINVIAAKLYAFAVAAAIASLGGVLLSMRQTNVELAQYNVFGSVLLIQYAVVGGIAWVAGIVSAIGAPTALGNVVFQKIVPDGTDIVSWLAVLSGLGAVAALRHAPDGVAALWSRGLHRAEGRSVPLRRFFEGLRFPRAGAEAPMAPPRSSAARLAVSDLVVTFGGVVAVDGVSFAIEPGEVVGLIGPNGAGKTTILDVVTGFTTPSSGSVRFGDSVVDRWSVERRARAGIVRSWQAVELFEEMTVRENLLVASDDQSRLPYLTDLFRPRRPAATALVHEVVEDLQLADVLDLRPSSLSHGVARLVGIARALVTEPAVLLLDEPAAGLDTNESTELGRMIRALAARRGIGVLVVEHDVPLILQTCDRIVALDFGHTIAEGTPDAISHDARVIEAYLGDSSSQTSLQPAAPTRPGHMSTYLEADGLSAGYGKAEIVRDLHLRVDAGEIVALLGPNGAGKTTTISTLSGELHALGGDVRLFGERTDAPLYMRARKGLGVVSQERAVLMDLTTRENLRVSRCDLDRALALFPELEPHLERRVGLLSGGQQQMLALARCLARRCRVLLIDELSLGLAPQIVDRLLRVAREAADEGMAVLLVEQHIHKALLVADRVLVMTRGRIALEGPASDLVHRLDDIQDAYLRYGTSDPTHDDNRPSGQPSGGAHS